MKITKKYDNFLYGVYKKNLLNDSDYEIRRKLIKELRKIINKNFCMNIELIGSFAYGVGTKTSDIDLVVLVNTKNVKQTYGDIVYKTNENNKNLYNKNRITTRQKNDDLVDMLKNLWINSDEQKEKHVECDKRIQESLQNCNCTENNLYQRVKNVIKGTITNKKINFKKQKLQNTERELVYKNIVTYSIDKDKEDFDELRTKNNKILKSIADLLQGKIFTVESLFYNATFPILRLKNSENDIKIDMSINQYNAVRNTSLIKNYIKKYKILKPILVIAKKICKLFDINNAYYCTLNSYAICLLCVYFLQVVYDLPSIYDTSDNNIRKDLSLSTMLIEMFFYYGYIFDFESDVISVRLAKITKKTEYSFRSYSIKNNTYMCIEDPVQTDFNVTRTVNEKSMKKIIKAFRLAHYFLMNNSSFLFCCN